MKKWRVSEQFCSHVLDSSQMKECSHLVFGLSESYSFSTGSAAGSVVIVHGFKLLPPYFVIMKMNAMISNLLFLSDAII